MRTDVVFRCIPWAELSRDDLYRALQLRQIVFCVEQSCVYLDLDGKDERAHHLFAERASDGKLIAYARIFPAGAAHELSAIGRVVTHPEARRGGFGKALMHEAIARASQISPGIAIHIGAQAYLERFYGELGFHRSSENYDEDGIPHLEMVRDVI